MKSYEEMAKYVLECRDKQLEAKKKRIKAIERYSSLAACLGLAAALSYKVFDKMNSIPRSDFMNESSVITSDAETSDNTTETTVKIYNNNTEISVRYTTEPETEVQTDITQKNTTDSVSGTVKEQTKKSSGTTTKLSAVSNTKSSSASKAKTTVTSVKKHSTSASTRKTLKTTAVTTAKPIKTTSHSKTSKETGKITEKPGGTNIESPDNTVPCFTVTNVPTVTHKPETISIDDNMVKNNFNHFTYNGTVYNLIVLESYDESVPFFSDEYVGEKIADIQIKSDNTSLTLDASIYHVTAEYINHGVAVRFDGGNRYYLFLS